MDEVNLQELEDHITRLERQTEPSKIDIKYGQIISYCNVFLSKFGRERIYIVGSTAERSKLTFSNDDGDADFLLVSGKLEIPVENLEVKKDNPCYVWIKSNDVAKAIGLKLVDEKYISASMLRELRPELFTLLRTGHAHFTSSFHKLTEFVQNSTIITVPSKVGLSSTKYKGLKLHADVTQIPCKSPDAQTNMLQKRYQCIKVHPSDKKVIKRFIKGCGLVKLSPTKHHHQAFVIQEMEKMFKSPEFAYMIQESTVSQPWSTDGEDDFNDSQLIEDYGSLIANNDLDTDDVTQEKSQNRFKATCTDIKHRDFVPAIRIQKSELKCVQQWQERVEARGWPASKIDELLRNDIFVVARLALTNPNIEKDFCLSFNLWEQTLVTAMTPVQRRVFLLLKAYLKGTFERKHAEVLHKESKLKTYHMKTLLFWQFEEKNDLYETNTSESVYKILKASLENLRRALKVRRLSHYFVPSCNLFLDFEDEDFEILIHCVDSVLCNPINGLKEYFDGERQRPMEVWLTQEEVECYWQMLNDDGGRRRHLDNMKEGIFDFFRAYDESKKDEEGRVPIKEAVLDTFKLFFDDEKHIDSELLKQFLDRIVLFLDEKKYPLLMKDYNRIKGDRLSIDLTTTGENKTIHEVVDFVIKSSAVIPEIGYEISSVIKGRYALARLFQRVKAGIVTDCYRDMADEILPIIDRYLSCADEEEAETFPKLQATLFGHFLNRQECNYLSMFKP